MAVVIKEAAYFLAHIPDCVRYGSKPFRDLLQNEDMEKELEDHLRTYDQAVGYAPHQVFIGNRRPDELHNVAKPWYEHPLEDAEPVWPVWRDHARGGVLRLDEGGRRLRPPVADP